MGYALGMTTTLDTGQDRSAEPSYPGLDQPGSYRIRISGHVRPGWATWFEGLELTTGEDDTGAGVTTLTGELTDQAALHGVLAQIRDLGLVLLLVERVDPSAPVEPSVEGKAPL